jgi:hypothetical protein
MSKKRPPYRKFHFIYKTTCVTTGKWYIGMHSTDDLEDGYLGSGQRLRRSVVKYGSENHKAEIVEFHLSRSVLTEREKEIVNSDLIKDPMCMNLMIGGLGNYPGKPIKEETLRKMSESMSKVPRTPEWRARISAAQVGRPVTPELAEKFRVRMAKVQWTPEMLEKRNHARISSEKFKQTYRNMIVDGVTYQNYREASAGTGLPVSTLNYRLKSPAWANYRFADQPEKTGEHLGPRSHRGSYKRLASIEPA